MPHSMVPANATKLRVSAVTERSALPGIQQRWNALASACICEVPYLLYEWYASALQTLERDNQPFVVLFQTAEHDVGLAPLVCKESHIAGFRAYELSFVSNAYTPEQGFLYVCPFNELIEALLDFLQQSFGNAFMLNLGELRLTHDQRSALESLAATGSYIVLQSPESQNLRVSLASTFESTLAGLDKKTRHEFERKQRRLQRLGKIALLRIETEADIETHLNRFFALYAGTWKGAEPRPDFYRLICSNFARAGKLYFVTLALDGVPIAYLIALGTASALYGVKTTYNVSFSAFAPGVILFYLAIKDVSSTDPVSVLDFGRGDERYKKEWAPSAERLMRVTIAPNALAHRVRYKFQNGIIRLKQTRLGKYARAALRSRLKPQKLATSPTAPSALQQVEITASDLNQAPGECVAQPAEAADQDWIAVLMAAPSLREVESRLARQTCIVVRNGKRPVACFWIDKNEWEAGASSESGPLRIVEWGIDPNASTLSVFKKCLSALFCSLRQHRNGPASLLIPFSAQPPNGSPPASQLQTSRGLAALDENSVVSSRGAILAENTSNC